MQNLTIDTGMQEYLINNRAVLRFNPSDPNLYHRFFAAAPKLDALDADEELIEWAHLDAVELLRYACNLDSVATRPLRDAVAMRYRHIFKEVSGG